MPSVASISASSPEMLEQLPTASRVGKTVVGGIDLNKARMRQVVEALIALSPSPNGFTASDVAVRVRALSKQSPCQYGPRHAAYDLKKLRGKQIVPPDRSLSPVRAASNRAQSHDCAARPPKQSYQTPPGRRSTSPPSPRRA